MLVEGGEFRPRREGKGRDFWRVLDDWMREGFEFSGCNKRFVDAFIHANVVSVVVMAWSRGRN